MEKLKIGEFVEYFSNGNGGVLPEGTETQPAATSAPAIVVAVDESSVHLNVFTADFTGASPVKQAWSVLHKSKAKTAPYWDYLPQIFDMM